MIPSSTARSQRSSELQSEPSPFLKAIQSLSSNSTSPPGQSVSPLDSAGISESLNWTAKKVNWLKGGSIYRSFSYANQAQDVIQALFIWFEVPENDELIVGAGISRNGLGDDFGPFQKEGPAAWSDDVLALPHSPTAALPPLKLIRKRFLMIFLEDIAFVYSAEGMGGSFPIQIPFRLHAAWAMDVGVLLERAPEGREVGNGELATLYSLLNPKEEIKVVSYTAALTGLFGEGQEEVKPKVEIPTNPIQDLNERIVFSSSRGLGEEPIYVSANEVTGQISIWSYGRIDLEEEISIVGAIPVEAELNKGKGKAMDLDESISVASAEKIFLPKRTRTSFTANQSTTANTQRRVSTTGLGSASIAGPSGGGLPLNSEESDLLEVLGETMGTAMKRTASVISAMSAAERRGSVTRNELSITLDRMALGGSVGASGLAISGEMDREATLYMAETEESRMASDLMVERIWSIELGKGSSDAFDGIEVHIFDTRSSTSSLAILLPRSTTLLVLTLSHIENGRIGVTPLHQASAIAACPVYCSRNNILDLVFVSPEQQWIIISARGRMEPISTPTIIPERKRLLRVEGDGSNEVMITLDDGVKQITNLLKRSATGLALECLQAIAAVTPFETFYNFQKAVSNFKSNNPSISHFESIFVLLGQPPAISKSPVSIDPILAGLRSSTPATTSSASSTSSTNPATSTYDFTSAEREIVFLGLHLLTEEMKLSSETMVKFQELMKKMLELAARLGLRFWVDHYLRLSGLKLETKIASTSTVTPLPTEPISIVNILSSTLIKLPPSNSLYGINSLASHFMFEPSEFYGRIKLCPLSSALVELYSLLSIQSSESPTARSQATVLRIHEFGWTRELIKNLSFGIALPLCEAIRLCQLEAPENWPSGAYELIRRDDLAGKIDESRVEVEASALNGSLPSSISAVARGCAMLEMGIDEGTTKHSKAIRFGEDRRLEEVERMLQYSNPVSVNGGDRSLEQLTSSVQQGILLSLSNRTLSLPVGNAIFSYRTKNSSPTETIPIIPLNLSARILPMSTVVHLHEKERADGAAKEKDRMEWPEFHSGVKAALELGGLGIEFDNSSISFNKPDKMTSAHGGFLMGLGLMGNISKILLNQAFEYLKIKHDPTSIGLLLGLAVNYVATGDEKLTSLLSVHLTALHPKNSTTLNVSGLTQSAALVSLGLLYLGTSKVTLADVMIKELCGMKVTSVEDSSACREAYALSAGFAFGFIMLGKGLESAQAKANGGQLGLLKTFKSLILGEMNHSLPGDVIPRIITDVNITSPAATIALALMFLKTERKDVADLLEIPDNLRKLDYVRSDLILLRILGKCLICWNSVTSSKEWVESNLPKFILNGLRNENKIDSEIDVARWNIIAGACFGIGLKFAGTARKEAHVTLIYYLDRLTRAAYIKSTTVQAKIKRHAIRCCLSVVAVSLAMVMAGTGELNVLRRLRIAHGHFSEGVTYGTHLSSHMALGLLFLGAGQYTLGTSNVAIAALVISFYPSFPSTPLENRAHLQAYRHLWTLAVEPRCVIAKDVDTGEAAFLPIRLRLKEKGNTLRSLELVAPTLIPEIRLIDSIQIDSPRYWPFSIHLANNPNHLKSFLKSGTVFVKRRTGHLSYSQDPRGNKSIFTRSKSETGATVFDFGEISKMLATPTEGNLKDFISSFTDEGESMESVKFLCPKSGKDRITTEFEAFSASVLLECLTKDKPDCITTYRSLFYAVKRVLKTEGMESLIGLEQIQFILEFYRAGIYEKVFKNKHKSSTVREPLLQKNLIDHIQKKIRDIPVGEVGEVNLRQYLLAATWPESEIESRKLASWLSIHFAPSLSMLEELKLKMSSVRGSGGKDEQQGTELLLRGTSVALTANGGKGWSEEFSSKLVQVLYA